jgi:hypothetical protein
MFDRRELIFEPGIFANRARRASRQRWVDGNWVRFRDAMPEEMGGWVAISTTGDPIVGRPCGLHAWRPNDQSGRLCVIGTHDHAYLFDGSSISDITPADLVAGRVDAVAGTGYGVGLYGMGTYGTPRTVTGQVLGASNWTFDMFGQTLIGCFDADGLIREFTSGSDALLTTIDAAPTARAICVTAERHLMAFGCDGNPRLVQWSDREDKDEWTPSGTTRAGGYEMQVYSPFQCAFRVRGMVLALTLSEVCLFSPTFNAFVYSRETNSEACGVAGPRAACRVTDQGGEMVMWMDVDGFYVFDGFARRLPCELHDFVFGDINLVQRSKFEASTNLEFQEVRFSYCSAGSNEIDRCVVLSLVNGAWSKAHIERTCWLDRKIFDKPLALNAAGELFEHESGHSADGAALPSFVLSHPIMLGTGRNFVDIGAFWPDLDATSSPVDVSIIGREWSGDVDQEYGPVRCPRTLEKADFYVSVREFDVKIEGTGGRWELGVPAVEWQPGGEA